MFSAFICEVAQLSSSFSLAAMLKNVQESQNPLFKNSIKMEKQEKTCCFYLLCISKPSKLETRDSHSRTREDPQNFFLSLNIWKMVYIDIIRMPCIGKKYLDSDLNIANHTHVPSQEVMLNMPNELFQCIMLRWGVPNWPPGENSIWCRKFSDGVESGGRVGTLRWAKEVPQCLVCRLIGGLLGVRKAKNGKMVIFKKKIKIH